MQVSGIITDYNFTGKIIYPEFLTPEIEKFKEYAHERISKIVQDQPFDVYVKSKKSGDQVFVSIKAGDSERAPNAFSLYILYEAIKAAKDKMLLEEVREFMSKAITPKITEELQLKESFKQSKFVPPKIGLNRYISSHPKYNKTGAKYIKRS